MRWFAGARNSHRFRWHELRLFALAGSLVLTLFPDMLHAQQWSWTWVRKTGTSGFNDSFCLNPLNENIIYASPGNNTIVISRDRGHTWQPFATVPGGSQIKAIEVSARDTSVILVAQESGPPDRIMKTTNGGATWQQTLAGNFYYWGHPLAYEPLHDNEVVYTQAGRILYRSTNFGSTWDSVFFNPFNSSNQGWEDALISPDSINVLIVSDNANGIWKTADSGLTWRHVYTASGEVPAIAVAGNDPSVLYATKWGGGGGLLKSTDNGENWSLIPLFNGINMWGVAVSTEDPNYVVANTWGPSFSTTGGAYISRDAGQTWERTYQGFMSTSNHSMLVLDTTCVLSLQSDGIWKLRFPGAISGVVFDDANCSGGRDSTEGGLAGYRVRLTGVRSDSTLTDSLGTFAFHLLGPGSYTVSVPVQSAHHLTSPPTGTYMVSVSDGEQHVDRLFGITAQSVAILTPNGGEVWQAGATHDVTWEACGPSVVQLEYSTNNGQTWMTIAESVIAATGSYPWFIPNTPSTQCRMRVSDYSDGSIQDQSNSFFTITAGMALPVQIVAGWNLISNPVSKGYGEDSVKHLYPNSMFDYVFAFAPASGYYQTLTMPNGRGFWGKFPAPELNYIAGDPRDMDSVNVTAGWNIIGSISSNVDTSWIRTEPSGLLTSPWYGYGSAYSVVTQLVPGGAYWVKSSGIGVVILRSTPPPYRGGR